VNSRIKRPRNILLSAICTLTVTWVHASPEYIPEAIEPHVEDRIPISKNLKKALLSRKVGALLLVNTRGDLEVIGLAGRPLEPCGSFVENEITGCGLDDVDLRRLNQITIYKTARAKNCIATRDENDVAYSYHAGNGLVPCHIRTKPSQRPHRYP